MGVEVGKIVPLEGVMAGVAVKGGIQVRVDVGVGAIGVVAGAEMWVGANVGIRGSSESIGE